MPRSMSVNHVVQVSLKNMEYLPLFYLMPKRILQEYHFSIKIIPRVPWEILYQPFLCRLIESDLFLAILKEMIADLVWPYLCSNPMDFYSENDPAWLLAHSPAYWMEEFQTEGILPTVEQLFDADQPFHFIPESLIDRVMKMILPRVMQRYNLTEVFKVTEQYRCFEDFRSRKNQRRTDFYRKWYHTRTKHPMISLEEHQDLNAKRYDGQRKLISSEDPDAEEVVTAQVFVEEFMETLSENDRAILQLRLEGKTLAEIAEELGYKNHSGVLKRIRKIGQAYEAFTGEDYGFREKKIV